MSNQQQNECGGILAYISNSKNEDGTKMAEGRNGVNFVKAYSDYLRRNPYVQCGVAFNDISTKNLATAKFNSVGEILKTEAPVEETKEENKKVEDDSDESSEEKKDPALDYGYLEKTNIQNEEDDCFHKLNESFKSSFSTVESNISVLHSRYC